MHPPDCPPWEYANHPKRDQVLRVEVQKILGGLRSSKIPTEALTGDSRPIHGQVFSALTPSGYSYFAGHFRGENFRCLKFCPVTAGGDPRVGHAPQIVQATMNAFGYRARLAFSKIDGLSDPLAKFAYAIRLASNFFELFLRIHPYMNGNGHMARFIVWATLGRYGYWPERWPVEPRPPDPPYILKCSWNIEMAITRRWKNF